MRNKKVLTYLLSILAVGTLCSTSFVHTPIKVQAEAEKIDIDYSSSKWVDNSPGPKWEIDPDLKMFEFNKNNDPDGNFTANTLITKQADNRDSTITMTATFKGSVTSDEIANDPESKEVQIGLVPWYIDANNWLMVYAGFKKAKDGHLFDVVTFAKLGGSTFVEFYVKDEDNRWIGPGDEKCTQWHSAWPDGINSNKNPSTLEETYPDPSDEIEVYVRKTRKKYAGKDCDSIFVKINGYELNFGRDNFMFSGFYEYEQNNLEANPGFGLYVQNTGHTYVNNFKVTISHDAVLPLPTVEAIGNLVKSGNVGSRIMIPGFIAYDNYGENLDYTIDIFDPHGNRVFMDGSDYFVPVEVGEYHVVVSATDKDGYKGTFEYTIMVKSGSNHLDRDVYNDILTNTPYDISIPIARAIFISIPCLIALYIALKIAFKIVKNKRKDK